MDLYAKIFNSFIKAEESSGDLTELFNAWLDDIQVDPHGLDPLYLVLSSRRDYWIGVDDYMVDWYSELLQGVLNFIHETPLLSEADKCDYLSQIGRG